jgi:hypothetical protein
MNSYKKILAITALFIFMIAGIAATKPDDADKHFKNLKVLSKDISGDDMDRVMFAFERQLGVTCLYCHVNTKNISPVRVDFASDEKNEKRVAREMLKMTMKINKKYFDLTIDKKILARPVVWCKTCHRGYPVPHIQ